MPLTIIPMVIHLMIGFVLWQSELSLVVKIIITLPIILKYTPFFCEVLMTKPDVSRYISVSVCAILNIGLLIYNIVNSEWFVLTEIAICLILFVIWSMVAVFSFQKGW